MFNTLPMLRPFRVLVCLAFFVSMAACAPKLDYSPEPVLKAQISEPELQLTPSAQAAFAYLRAQELERRGDQEDARHALQLAMALEPNPFLTMELANSYWREGKTTEARQVLRGALQIFPGDQILSSALVNAYLADNMSDEAISIMEQYLQRSPHDWQMRRNMAALLLQYARYAHAADILSAIPESERTAEIRFLLAKSNAGLGLTRQTEEQLLLALEQDPYFLEALAELAFLYETEGDLVRAEETYRRILELRPDADDILLRMVQVNVTLNQPEQALSLALSQFDRESFVLDAALIFIGENLFQEAKILLDTQHPDEGPPEADFYRALIAYEGEGDPEQALVYLGRIPDDHLHYSRALSFQGYLLLQMERIDEAHQLAREGRVLFPNLSDFLLLEAEIFLGEDNMVQASKLLEEARRKWPGDTDVLYRLGYLQEQVGHREEALRTMEEIVALDPDHAEALNFIGYTLTEEGRELERALVLIENALKLKPGSGHIIDSLAWVHYKLGNLEEAWRHIRSAVEIMADDPTIWEHYGDIAAAKGKKDQARKGYNNALLFQTKHPNEVQRKLKEL
ncbi:Flp pilus assembly protein TadD, contains TPR repeats [Desulfonatronum thiosulfatophilum]|uniref:Flp pilus assembly protein TadD, contains TPR repeats n=1 Tax=Desulfonatronum thiosulfatophilum TaxID=617002 RepID=A0A1G6A7T6_9BACT|nr:tetratricopeptide repeat protein [Desulfonatronum thiosulfatophilum]SDB04439.1 Flp pilus assembly protein TadD, contains TPR repeats [Desulfonatronum thiosulfatophilum]